MFWKEKLSQVNLSTEVMCRLRSKGRRATWKRLGTCSGKGRNMFKPESEKKLDAYKNPQEV